MSPEGMKNGLQDLHSRNWSWSAESLKAIRLAWERQEMEDGRDDLARDDSFWLRLSRLLQLILSVSSLKAVDLNHLERECHPHSSNKKLLVTSASLLVTRALLVVTRSY